MLNDNKLSGIKYKIPVNNETRKALMPRCEVETFTSAILILRNWVVTTGREQDVFHSIHGCF